MTAVLTTVLTPADALRELRATTPLVQCVTNAVATGFTANVLLAIGAAPAMADLPGEAGGFATIADGSLINLGTPTAEQRRAAFEVAAATQQWVLDPVAVGVLPVRTTLAAQLVEERPAIIRGNASEIVAVAGEGAGGRGVDSTINPEAAAESAVALARRTGAVIATSGPVDLITDGARIVRVAGGDVMLTRVTGGGCALGAIMAAFLGVCAPLPAAVAACLTYARASEAAAASASGPGSFAVALLDTLAALEPATLEEGERVTESAVEASLLPR